MTHEYAFDVKLCAVIRVKAPNEALARKMLEQCSAVDMCCQVVDDEPEPLTHKSATITEVSIDTEDSEPFLFEIDGEDADEDDEEEDE